MYNEDDGLYRKAIKEGNWWALNFIEDQTVKDCEMAININSQALRFVVNQTPEICLYAIKRGLEHRDDVSIPWTPEMEREWVIRNI